MKKPLKMLNLKKVEVNKKKYNFKNKIIQIINLIKKQSNIMIMKLTTIIIGNYL